MVIFQINAMSNTGRISNQQRNTRVGFCLKKTVQRLHIIGAVRQMCNIDIFIIHGDARQIFFRGGFACCREFCHSPPGCSFRSLSACIGVHFSIQYQNIKILARCQHVIKTSISNIIGPAISPNYPHTFTAQIIRVTQ